MIIAKLFSTGNQTLIDWGNVCLFLNVKLDSFDGFRGLRVQGNRLARDFRDYNLLFVRVA